MKLIEQLITCVFTYIFAFLGVYVWNIGTSIKWVAILPLILAVVSYFKFSLSLVLGSPHVISSKKWFYILCQIVLLVLNIFVIVYVINNVVI